MTSRGVDIEAVLVAHLGAALGCRVATEVPNPRPERLVKVTRTGGARVERVVDTSTVVVEVWPPPTTRSPAEMALDAQQALWALEGHEVGGVFVVAVECRNPVCMPDPDTDAARYVMTAEVTVHAI